MYREEVRDRQRQPGCQRLPGCGLLHDHQRAGQNDQKVGIRFNELPDEEFDAPLGLGTGAAVIFGATGGVMEAALRTAVETLTGEELQKLDFTDVRGTEGIKEATYNVAGMDVKVAVASGLGNAKSS